MKTAKFVAPIAAILLGFSMTAPAMAVEGEPTPAVCAKYDPEIAMWSSEIGKIDKRWNTPKQRKLRKQVSYWQNFYEGERRRAVDQLNKEVQLRQRCIDGWNAPPTAPPRAASLGKIEVSPTSIDAIRVWWDEPSPWDKVKGYRAQVNATWYEGPLGSKVEKTRQFDVSTDVNSFTFSDPALAVAAQNDGVIWVVLVPFNEAGDGGERTGHYNF